MDKLYYILFFFITFKLAAAQDSLKKYSPQQLAYKSSMATRLTNKPLLWRVYLNAMLKRNPTESLKVDTYYNLSWDVYLYTDYSLDFVINMMKQAIYPGKKAHYKRLLLYSLESFYAMKNDNRNILLYVEEIKKIHNLNSIDEIM